MLEQTKEEVKSQTPANLRALPAVPTAGGVLQWTDIEGLQRVSKYLLASKMLPRQYDTPEKVGIGLQYAVQLGFRNNWLLALRNIAIVNGTPSLFGDLPLAVAQESGGLEWIYEFLVDKEGNEICLKNKNLTTEMFASVCRIKRKNYPEREVVFTIQDAKVAGIWGKNVWAQYPKRMIQCRARSQALKDMFPDALNGISLGEYEHNTILEEAIKDVQSTSENLSTVDALNALKVQEPAVLPPEAKPEPEVEPEEEKQPDIEVQPEQGAFADFSETKVGG